ncbi:MAG: 5-(carboxyamino)imidazole ribonucleotide mutase [Thermoprotei archaeon]|jgi:5-(carboxyamino)imidazole ribonucleotide mutase
MPLVSVIIGSENDKVIGDKICEILKNFNIDIEYRILSAHRNPKELEHYIEHTRSEIFIAVAGLSAALPGFIASRTLKPVIGVPRDVKLGGLDALLSIAQMPRGVPVACVGIDNGENAALLALRILAIKYSDIKEKLEKLKEKEENLQQK